VQISREEAAAETILLWEEEHRSLRRALRRYAEERGIEDWQIRTAIHSLVFETVRRLNTVDYVVNQVLNQGTMEDVHTLTRNVLRVATYQILFGGGVPALVTNEAVSIVKKRAGNRLAGFCNAVLRKVQTMDVDSLLDTLPEPQKTALKFSVPTWMAEYAEKLLGPEEARAFFAAGLRSPTIYVRVNTLRNSIEEAVQDLKQEGFECTSVPYVPEVLRIRRGPKPVTRTNAYTRGAIYLQSLSSALVSKVLNPKPTDVLVDMCAAPGSKTTHLAQLMGNRGAIIAMDNSWVRVQELLTTLERMGVHNTHVLLASGLEPPFRKDFRADGVLVDPPCSNTGVIQTRPEAKWNTPPNAARRICRVQRALLERGAGLVTPGGHVVYSTCAITLEENEQLIHSFLEGHPNFELTPAEPWLGTPAFEGLNHCQRLFPHREDSEGFFIAKLRRKAVEGEDEELIGQDSPQAAYQASTETTSRRCR